jgi:hypothetical protein
MSRLNVADLRVESFTTVDDGEVVTLESESEDGCGTHEGPCGTHSLNYATHCDCSAPGPVCTLDCVEYSRATDYQACCG